MWIVVTAAMIASQVNGQSVPPTEPNGSGSVFSSPEQAKAAVQSLIDLVLPKLPRSYSSDKHWDKRKKVWAGVKFDREGLRIKTKRRWREVRHGRWTRYEVSMPGDASRPPPIAIAVQDVQEFKDEDGQVTWKIRSHAKTPLDFTARIERWNLGAKWYTFTVRGHMQVSLELTSTLSSRVEYTEIPPALVIDPKVVAATFRLDEFHVDRISKIGGEVAEAWGEIAEKVAQEIMIKDYNEKLVAKLNRSIDKHRDDLRFSTADLLAKIASSSKEEPAK